MVTNAMEAAQIIRCALPYENDGSTVSDDV